MLYVVTDTITQEINRVDHVQLFLNEKELLDFMVTHDLADLQVQVCMTLEDALDWKACLEYERMHVAEF